MSSAGEILYHRCKDKREVYKASRSVIRVNSLLFSVWFPLQPPMRTIQDVFCARFNGTAEGCRLDDYLLEQQLQRAGTNGGKALPWNSFVTAMFLIRQDYYSSSSQRDARRYVRSQLTTRKESIGDTLVWKVIGSCCQLPTAATQLIPPTEQTFKPAESAPESRVQPSPFVYVGWKEGQLERRSVSQ